MKVKVRVKTLQKNQYIIYDGENVYFQSYDTIIAMRDGKTGEIVLDPDYDISRTTSKYLAQFLNRTSKEIKEKVEKGVYKIEKLNG